VDLDGDGVRDVISGSWPGALHVFRGQKDGQGVLSYAEPTTLTDKDGKAIDTGQASVVHAVDWDRDGDVDLVVGCIDGWVWFVPNESGDKRLLFGPPVKLEADGVAIHEHHSGPTVADWDGDGTLDLVVGQGDGNVFWYANAARAGAPRLGPARLLHAGPAHGMSDGSRCGGRVKPCVADWNGDGRPDLLLGDFGVKQPEKRKLTEAQAKELADLEAQQRAVTARLTTRYTEAAKAALRALGHDVGEDPEAPERLLQRLTEEERQAYAALAGKTIAKDTAIRELQSANRTLLQAIVPLKGQPSVIGQVWVRLREAPAKAPPAMKQAEPGAGPGAQR